VGENTSVYTSEHMLFLYCNVAVSCCVLQCLAVCCSVLLCVAVCCSEQRHIIVHQRAQVVLTLQCCSVQQRGSGLIVLQCVAACCSVVQYVSVCCSVLQCVAEEFNELKDIIVRQRAPVVLALWRRSALQWVQHVAACCSVLPCVAVCCSVLQCVAVFENLSVYTDVHPLVSYYDINETCHVTCVNNRIRHVTRVNTRI